MEDYSDPNSSTNQSYNGSGFGYMKPEPSNMKVEDEEDLLYGESGSSFKMNNVSTFGIATMITIAKVLFIRKKEKTHS